MPDDLPNHFYFEDFTEGEIVRHYCGKTMTEMDQVLIMNLVMNTAASHFDEHLMVDHMFKKRVAFGGVTTSSIISMAAQDATEDALEELLLDNMWLTNPVFHGDTLYTYSEVTGKEDAEREDAGIVQFHHCGVNAEDQIVFEAIDAS